MIKVKKSIKKLTYRLFEYDNFGNIVEYVFVGLIATVFISSIFFLAVLFIVCFGFWTPIVLVIIYSLYRLGKQIANILDNM